jgi:hypothetical protein
MVEAFLEQLEKVPWFANVGKPIPLTRGVKQIHSWEEWPGPEDTDEIHLDQQALYDEIMENAKENQPSLELLWNRIHDTVERVARKTVPYDPNKDAWHGPTLAVWHAAWTAGLIGLCLQLNRPISPELQEQWRWFLQGHWPFFSQSDSSKENLVVF